MEVPTEALNYQPGQNSGNLPGSNRSLQQSQLSQSAGRLKYLGDLKSEKSFDFFKATRVNSCSYVKLQNGLAKAVAYYNPPKETFADKMGKSEYVKSVTHDTYKVRPYLHTGMPTKPLETYDPNSYRNRLPVIDAKQPSKNGSQIEIGNRSELNNRHFISQNRNTYGNFGSIQPITNPGILSEKTKWHHKQQNK